MGQSKYAGFTGHPPKKLEVKSNFLRKGYGRGGSPTEFDTAVIDPQTGVKLDS